MRRLEDMPVDPPIPVCVLSTLDLARLALALVEDTPHLWYFRVGRQGILGTMFSYTYWGGDLPIFAYVKLKEKPEAFLAYRSGGSWEECLFSREAEDPKYRYALVVHLKKPPKIFVEAVEGKYNLPPAPVIAEVEDTASLARALLSASARDGVQYPIWHFVRNGVNVLGACIPFEHYYNADALPIFYYVRLSEPPSGPFIKYRAAKPKGEEVSFSKNTVDVRYLYLKVISIKDFPIVPIL